MRMIFLEGNIGAGKSTLISRLEQGYKQYKADDEAMDTKEAKYEECKEKEEKKYQRPECKRVLFIQEPVHLCESLCDSDGKSLISEFYTNKTKHAFSFQMYALCTRFQQLKDAIDSNAYDILVCERSIFTDRYIFAQMMRDDGNLDDFQFEIYKEWFKFVTTTITLTDAITIYLKTDPVLSASKIYKRQRIGEEHITLDYLTHLHNLHEQAFSSSSSPSSSSSSLSSLSSSSHSHVMNIDDFQLGTVEYDDFTHLILHNYILNPPVP